MATSSFENGSDGYPGGVLVMTATVVPPASVAGLSRTDVDLRIKDYRDAFTQNLSLLKRRVFSHLVLVDNSGYDISIFEDIRGRSGLADRIELISFDDNRATETGSRFIGECELLVRTLELSWVLRTEGVRRFWKITGRYTVRNLEQIVRRARRDIDVNLHFRRYPQAFVDFGLAGFSLGRARAFLEYAGSAARDTSNDERQLLMDYDAGKLATFRIEPRFPLIPDFRGVRGYDNASYGGLAYRAKFLLRSLAGRVVPTIWI